jgi:predicted dehydrogenase
MTPVTIDDACSFLCRFANGAMGTFESTRYARGHKAGKTFELNGQEGSLRFDLEQSEYLDLFEYRSPGGAKVGGELAGWRRIHVTSTEHPYMARWWVPGLGIGFEHSFTHALADFLAAVFLAWDRYRGLGHALLPGWLVARSGSLNRKRVALATDGIIGWNIRRSYFQRRAGLATLIATTAAGRHRYEIPDLPFEQAWPIIESVSG